MASDEFILGVIVVLAVTAIGAGFIVATRGWNNSDDTVITRDSKGFIVKTATSRDVHAF